MVEAWWPMPTTLINETSGGVADFFVKYPSTLLGNAFAAGIVLMVWIFTFSLSLAIGTRKALAVSSFVTLILSIYLMKYLNPVILIALVFMTIVGLIGGKSESSI